MHEINSANKGRWTSPRTNAVLASGFVAQTESNRAMTIPWIAARATTRWQVSWLAGHHAVQSLPGPRRI